MIGILVVVLALLLSYQECFLSVKYGFVCFHMCLCYLVQEDILDLQLQRNLDYLDQQVRGHTHSIVCHYIFYRLCFPVSVDVAKGSFPPLFPITFSFPMFLFNFPKAKLCVQGGESTTGRAGFN